MPPLRASKAFGPVNDSMFDFGASPAFLPLQQSAPYADAVAACGARAGWHDLGCGRALVVQRGRMRLIWRGPIWEAGTSVADQRAALRGLARWLGLTVVTPETGIAGFGFVPLVTPLHQAIWDLGCDLRAGMAGKWRNRLVAAERAGVRVARGKLATLDWLIRNEATQRGPRGYRALPEGFSRALPAPALRLWHWRERGQVEAGMAFVVHGTSATYHLGWGSDRARAAGVHPVMLAQAACALRSEGVRWLDLGSVDSEGAPGLARFKLGTGARLHRLGATMLVLP